MHRSRERNVNRGIPQPVYHRRSSSMEIANRGSYLPPNRHRSNSTEKKQSVGKPLYRSTPKKAPSFGNNRGSSLQRGSSVSKKGPVKDPRPLTDKNYQKQCIGKLVEYLEENNFPYSLTPNSLSLPTKKEFEMLFQFVYSFWDPKYEMQKIEDEVPKIMKSMGYPYAAARSSLLSITKMSWPQLLGIIMWLVDLNKSCSIITIDNYLISDEFKSNMQTSLLDHICNSYEMGTDDNEKDKEVFLDLIRRKYQTDIDFEEVRKENEMLEKMIAAEIEEQQEYQLRIQENEKLEEDMINYQTYIEQMNKHISMKSTIYENLKEKNAEKEKKLKELKNETTRLEALYKTQGFDGEQAQNFYQTQKETLTKKLIQKREQVKQEEKKYWDLEIEYANLNDKAQTEATEFQHKWNDLQKLLDNLLTKTLKTTEVPAAKKLCRDYNFNLPDFVFHPKFKDDVRPILESAKAYIENNLIQIKNIIAYQEQHIQKIKLTTSEKEIQCDLMIAQLKQKEREMDLKMKNYVQVLEELKGNCHALEKKTTDAQKLNRELQERLHNLKKKKDDLKKQIKQKEHDLDLFKTKGEQTLKNIDTMIENSKKKCETTMTSLVNAIDEHMKFVKENPLPM